MTALTDVINDLYIVEGDDEETRLSFETRLRDEFAADTEFESTNEMLIDLPFDVVPDECADGQDKLD